MTLNAIEVRMQVSELYKNEVLHLSTCINTSPAKCKFAQMCFQCAYDNKHTRVFYLFYMTHNLMAINC